jgi:micrococcal nuclease
MKNPVYVYRATIESIYDGDTFRANIDLGMDVELKEQSFRMFGINAPELKKEQAEAGRAARDWLRAKMPIGTRVIIATIKERKNTNKDSKEKYGRYLANIFLENEDVSINDQMIELGYAEPYLL